jgi:uncharacterized protein YrrD
MISFRKAHGLQVVAKKEGAIVGRFDDFQFDLATRSIYGYRIKGTGMFAKAGGVAANALDQIGRDVAFVGEEASVEWSGGGRNVEDGRAWASQYRGTRVMSRNGVSLGTVEDFVFDPGADMVMGLVLDGERIVELGPAVATGPAAVIIEDASMLQNLPAEERSGPGEADWRKWFRFGRTDEED